MIWKTVKFNSLYEVSEAGDVRNVQTGNILKPHFNRGGYRRLMFRRDGKLVGFTIARLVAEAFHGPKPFDGAEVCHGDGNKKNDRYTNLRWDTHASNIADKHAHGTWARGEKHSGAKLTEGDVIQIRELVARGVVKRRIAEQFNVSPSMISAISARKFWSHVA